MIDNITEEGYIIVQQDPTFVVDLAYDSPTKNWLLKLVNGNYISIRQLETWEIMQAEDQRDYGIIIKQDIIKHA